MTDVCSVPHGVNVSSYTPEVGMPIYPDPTLSSLEIDGSVSASLPVRVWSPDRDAYFWEPSAAVPLSSVTPGVGQLMNLMPCAIASGIYKDTPVSGEPGTVTPSLDTSSRAGIIAGSLMGAFPDGSGSLYGGGPTGGGIAGSKVFIFSAFDFTLLNQNVYETYYSGIFNSASSMDASGFVTMCMSGAGIGPPQEGPEYFSSTSSGLCISGSNELSSDGTIEYSVLVGSGDVGMANLYGGIYHLGLWTINMDRSLKAGNSPPFSFDQLNNPRKYRLFARKGLSKNLCYITDKPAATSTGQGFDNYTDLLIKWRIRFL